MRVYMLLILISLLPLTLAVEYHDYYGPYGGDDFVTWEEDYFENNKSHATPPFAPRQTFGGCYISTGKGLLDDLDCDKVPDPNDNCLGIANPEQADQNQNGLGDACDLIVEAIELDPPVVLSGRAFIADVQVTNYHPFPLRNIKYRFQVPELGLEEIVYEDQLENGEQGRYEFFLRIPDCVRAKEYDAVLFTEVPRGPGEVEVFPVALKIGVQQNQQCIEEQQKSQKSIITILDIQDVAPLSGGVYPFTIVNDEREDQAYVLQVDGTDEWGSYEIRPRSMIVVPAGGSAEGELVIYSREGASGEHAFTVTVTSKDDAQSVLLTAKLKDIPPVESAPFMQFGVFIIGLIIIIVFLAYLAHRRFSN